MKNLQNSILTILMAAGLAITGLTPAHAAAPTTAPIQVADIIDTESLISAPATAALTFDRPTITTSPAKIVDAPVEIVQPQSSESVSTVATTSTPKAVAPQAVPVAAATPVVPVAAPVTVHAASGSAIAAAALAQLGVHQDCTALVSNSLAAVGIHFHGWPADYMSLGHIVPAAAAQPGDLAYYANGGTGVAHIAVYIGNGQAVHGGWNGGTTAVYSVNVGSGPVFIHIG